MKENKPLELTNELKNYMKKAFLSYDITSRERAIKCLLYYYENKNFTGFQYVQMVDQFFKDIMFPLEFSNTSWVLYNFELERLLEIEKDILKKLYPESGNWNSNITEKMDSNNPQKIIQRLKLYFCVLYWSSGRTKQHKRALEELLEVTKKNINYLLENESAKNVYEKNETYGIDNFYLLEFEPFEEPLSTLYHNFGNGCYDSEQYIDIYNFYVEFIENAQCENEEQESVRKCLETIAKQRLEELKTAKFIEDLDDKILKKEERKNLLKRIIRETILLVSQAIIILASVIYAHIVHIKSAVSVKSLFFEILIFLGVLTANSFIEKLGQAAIERYEPLDESTNWMLIVSPQLVGLALSSMTMALAFLILFSFVYDDHIRLSTLLFFSTMPTMLLKSVSLVFKHKKQQVDAFVNELTKDNELMF